MDEYMTKKEATDFLGKGRDYLNSYIAKGIILVIPDPTDGRKKLLLSSDVYGVKAEAEKRQEEERKQVLQDPQFLKNLTIKELRLDLIDMVSPYGVTIRELFLFDEEVQSLAELAPEIQRKNLYELAEKIKGYYKKQKRVR